ncbi:MAG: metal-dependent hydrolase, partial [Chitinophagales bacterium]
TSFITTPTPLNNLLWYDLAKTKDGFYIGYRSIFDKQPAMQLTFVPQNDSMLGDLRSDKGVQKLIRFSQDYYCITKHDSSGINFHDMRFGQIGGWDNPNADFVFSYYITKEPGNYVNINQGRFEASTGEAFNSLIRRIRGVD